MSFSSSKAGGSSSDSSTLPPDLFDSTTIISLLSTVAIVVAAYYGSRVALPSSRTPTALRTLFIWHCADGLVHLILEFSFLYHCFFSWVPARSAQAEGLVPSAFNYLGYEDERVYGSQAAEGNPLAALWMVYARADRRWAGADLVSSFACLSPTVRRELDWGEKGSGWKEGGASEGESEPRGRVDGVEGAGVPAEVHVSAAGAVAVRDAAIVE